MVVWEEELEEDTVVVREEDLGAVAALEEEEDLVAEGDMVAAEVWAVERVVVEDLEVVMVAVAITDE